jgi:hypothetical protein
MLGVEFRGWSAGCTVGLARFGTEEHVGVRGGHVEGGRVFVLRARQPCSKDQFNCFT